MDMSTNQCQGCSVHPSICEMYERTKSLGISTVFDRYESQQPQCKFGMEGVCCQLCSHGPCRITTKAPMGICGATADTIVARNFLRLAVHGAAAYAHHLEEICETLIATAKGQTPFTIRDESKLREVAGAFGLPASGNVNELAVKLAEVILAELRKSAKEPLAIVETYAPETRKAAWRKLGVMPGGVLSEIRDALTKSMTSIDSDPTDLLLTTMRLSIAAGYMGLVATITLQDILLGTPELTRTEADLGVIDPDYVNIVAHGHVPLVGTAVLMAAKEPKMQELARSAGAKGIRVLGSMCTGQELMQRSASSATGFAGQLGNWITQEFFVATGAVDLVMMDMNCSIPGIVPVAGKFHTRIVCVDKVVRLSGVSEYVDYSPEQVAEQARDLIRMAVEAYGARRASLAGGSQAGIKVPEHKAGVLAGFSVESILGALEGSLTPLLDAIKSGAIKGIAAVVGCTNNKNGHDTMSVALTKELIKRNILVINAGCVSSAIQIEGLMEPDAARFAGDGLRPVLEALGIPPCLNFGSCVDIGRIGVAVTMIANALGVDPSMLPVAASAPEYLEQKAVVDGVFAVAFGLLVHLAPVPPVVGSSLVTQILTSDIEGLVGGRVAVELDPIKAADLIEEHIEGKRRTLGI